MYVSRGTSGEDREGRLLLAVVRWVVIVICLLCCASRSCVLGSCADLLSPPALLCHVAVCVWVSMFAIWILDFLRLFVYLFMAFVLREPGEAVQNAKSILSRLPSSDEPCWLVASDEVEEPIGASQRLPTTAVRPRAQGWKASFLAFLASVQTSQSIRPVSYTHLTLPTICSV